MKKAQLMEALSGGAKDPKSSAAELLEKMKSGKSFTLMDLMKDSGEKFAMEIKRPVARHKEAAMGLEGTTAPSPKSSPKVQVKPAAQTLEFPPMVKKGRGLSQSKAKVAPAPARKSKAQRLQQIRDLADVPVAASEDPDATIRQMLARAIEVRGMAPTMEMDKAMLEARYKKKTGKDFVPPPKPVGMKRQGEGRGRLQRRSPKTLRLLAKDKGEC
jgi:hypothetical protein